MVRAKKWKVGDRVLIPSVKGKKFAGIEMIQDPRNVGKFGLRMLADRGAQLFD